MSKVSCTVKLNFSAIRKLTKAQVTALEQTAEALHTEVVQAQVMPFDKGTLQNLSTFVDTKDSANGHVKLISSTPYARRLYFHPEYHYQTHENPNAGGKWFEDWVSGDKKDFCKKTYKKLYKQIGGV